MKQIEGQRQEQLARPIKKYVPLISGLVISGAMALSPFAMAQRASPQCSAQVQSGTMPSFHTTGARGVHLINTGLIRRPNSYVSITLPASYVEQVTRAARGQPEAQRGAFVGGILQQNIQLALTGLGTRTSVTFDCASLTATSSASVSAPVVTDAGVRESAPAASQRPPSDAGPQAQDDAGASRRRVIQPGQ
ncbi:MAG TPA: hypothetical protein VLD37_05325 [Candidatus Bilamarchaeum sp.]|nr:hypothetical protein [Candidatus Bilamarchaeum sp.]